ncbi:MAG: hypothetical protein NVS3B13_34700 [Mucilaginibacter sp.]
MGFNSFTVRNGEEWDSYVNQAFFHDIFHSWKYHSLNEEGEPLLFVYQENDLFIALPVIKRKIENSAFFDMTSVYGYSGPISNIDLVDLPKRTIRSFKAAFVDFMKKENAVCIFSRLHPFIEQQHILENIGGLRENGSTLYIDLTQPVEYQRSKYNKRLFRQIRKLRENGYTIKEASDISDVKAFVEMYHKNMDRLNAASQYYFDEQYFTNILDMDHYDNKLILIYNGTELICGGVVLLSDNIIRNHLSATSPDYLKDSPSKLLTDEISMIGRTMGKKIFHLGGGVGGKEDSLFMFKRYFSDLQVKDRIWCYVNDAAAYRNIVAKAGFELLEELL